MRRFLAFGAVIGASLFITACSSNSGTNAVPNLPQGAGSSNEFALQRLLPDNVKMVCPQVSLGYARCNSQVRTDIVGGAHPDVAGLGPADLQAAYKLPSSTNGAGQTIAIVDAYDNPNVESDLGVYRSNFGLPACTTANGCFKKLNQQGQQGNYPQGNTGWGAEMSLDVDMVSAACPKCNIIVVEGNSNSFSDLAISNDTAVTAGANGVSNSYGGGGGDSFGSHYNHPGHIILASSGDGGYGTQFPADQPFVVSLGGTSLRRSTGPRGWTETVWNGTGSGCTTQPKPSYQHDSGCGQRTMNDIAAVADPNTGVAVYDTYGAPGWQVYGGTSASSPLVAGVYGLAANASSHDTPASLYITNKKQRKKKEWDVISGSNGSCGGSYLCTGKVGYDGPTGNGTPKGVGAF